MERERWRQASPCHLSSLLQLVLHTRLMLLSYIKHVTTGSSSAGSHSKTKPSNGVPPPPPPDDVMDSSRGGEFSQQVVEGSEEETAVSSTELDEVVKIQTKLLLFLQEKTHCEACKLCTTLSE